MPFHEAGNAVTTDEYVLWQPDSEQIGWYDTSFGIDGTVRFVSVEEAAETTIGDRLKYWRPDLTSGAKAQLAEFELPESEVEPESRLSADSSARFSTRPTRRTDSNNSPSSARERKRATRTYPSSAPAVETAASGR